MPWPAQPYHRTDPNHRSIVRAIAVQTTLVTTRNTKPNPNIASARYSVPTVAPTPTNKAHAARPMRLMFNWKRRLARLQGGFGRDSIGGKHKLHLHNITSQQERSATEPWHQGATYPVASDQGNQPPVVQRRTREALANSGACSLVGESDHPLAAVGVIAQTPRDVAANFYLHTRLAEVDVAVTAQLKAHRVLHNPVKPLRITDKKVRRSEAIREVGEDGQAEWACCWISNISGLPQGPADPSTAGS